LRELLGATSVQPPFQPAPDSTRPSCPAHRSRANRSTPAGHPERLPLVGPRMGDRGQSRGYSSSPAKPTPCLSRFHHPWRSMVLDEGHVYVGSLLAQA